MRGTDGERKHIGRFVRPWVLEMLALYNDIADDRGQLRPLVAGGVYQQPAREWLAMRVIRSAYADERSKALERERKRGKN